MSPPVAYTVGHSTRPEEEFLALLGQAGITQLIDVRAFPSSRRHPHFNQGALREWLPDAGIAYRHLPGLGGRRPPVPGSRNAGWRDPSFRAYADHMASAEFRAGLAELETAARHAPTTVMCAEAVWWRCHRQLIADALVARGWRVEHLGVGGSPRTHTLTAFASVEADGTLTYPPQQGTLLDL